jgi:hypothetical protein
MYGNLLQVRGSRSLLEHHFYGSVFPIASRRTVLSGWSGPVPHPLLCKDITPVPRRLC